MRLQGTLQFKGESGAFTFDIPQSHIASGQSMVLYKGDEVLGGGVMDGDTANSEIASEMQIS